MSFGFYFFPNPPFCCKFPFTFAWFVAVVSIFFGVDVVFLAPVSLSIAFCWRSLSAGENYFFFTSGEPKLRDPVLLFSKGFLLFVEGLTWFPFGIWWEDATGRTGGLYYVFLGGAGVLMLGVVLRRLVFSPELEILRSFLISLVFFSKFCLTKLLCLTVLLFPTEWALEDWLTTDGALLELPTLLPCLLPPEWEWSRFEISFMLAFFLAC